MAGADYWLKGGVRRFIGIDVFNAVLIDREHVTRDNNPVSAMTSALEVGDSLIVFPEGTRNTGNELLLPLKSGLYHLAKAHPEVDLVPAWIENLNRVLPKGEVIPIPLVCTVTFGPALHVEGAENKQEFLKRMAAALLELSGREEAE